MDRNIFDKGFRLLIRFCKSKNTWLRVKNDLFTRQNRNIEKFFENLNGIDTYNGHSEDANWTNFYNYKSVLGKICDFSFDEVLFLCNLFDNFEWTNICKRNNLV